MRTFIGKLRACINIFKNQDEAYILATQLHNYKPGTVIDLDFQGRRFCIMEDVDFEVLLEKANAKLVRS